ncbi:uncharacterized protein LOC130685287 [Daphnia carinata]|uniref:uncharacterized protein LOC130685287 n=1 Tax=Daphnia carinata TaxID=120202 RepID=UPI00257A9EA9|nr:uncharacterized protein LOC130685287 [Daphnia carinata]
MKRVQLFKLMILVSFLTVCALAKTTDDETNAYSIYPDVSYSSPNIDGLKTNFDLTELTRHARHRPFLAGAAVGAVVANNRHPTYYAPSYYYPPTYYPSSYNNDCNCNG